MSNALKVLVDELREDMEEARLMSAGAGISLPKRSSVRSRNKRGIEFHGMDSGAKKKKRTNFNPKKHRWVTMGGNPVMVPRRGGAPVNPPNWMSDKQGKKPSLLRRILDKLQKR